MRNVKIEVSGVAPLVPGAITVITEQRRGDTWNRLRVQELDTKTGGGAVIQLSDAERIVIEPIGGVQEEIVLNPEQMAAQPRNAAPVVIGVKDPGDDADGKPTDIAQGPAELLAQERAAQERTRALEAAKQHQQAKAQVTPAPAELTKGPAASGSVGSTQGQAPANPAPKPGVIGARSSKDLPK